MMEGAQFTTTTILLVIASCLVQMASGLTKAACFSDANKTLNLDCGRGHLLHITRAFYGFSPTGRCGLLQSEAEQGCTLDDRVHYGCVGQRSCSINLPTGRLGVSVPDCGQRSNYFQVEYTCVRASAVNDICQHNHLTAQTGYITTPGYPNNYHKQGKCNTTIEVSAGQKIRLHIIDLELLPRGRGNCTDLLYFNDKLHSITLCGTRNNYNYNLLSNHVHMELMSTSRGRSKGFWLYYEAYPPLPTSMDKPDATGTTNNNYNNYNNNNRDTDRSNSGSQSRPSSASNPEQSDRRALTSHNGGESGQQVQEQDSTVPLYRDHKDPGKRLPFAAIAGGVIGTLSLILMVLLLLLFIKWCKERRYQKAEKILEIRNPAFRSSNDFHETQANAAGYYC